MEKHTPGPRVLEVIDGDLVVSQPGIDGQVVVVFRNTPLDAEWKANAALIAAAPDLLEACKGMLEWARRVKVANPGMEVADAVAAIAKAGGGE